MDSSEKIERLVAMKNSIDKLLRDELFPDELSPETQEIIQVFERLSPEYRKRVIEVAKLFIGQ